MRADAIRRAARSLPRPPDMGRRRIRGSRVFSSDDDGCQMSLGLGVCRMISEAHSGWRRDAEQRDPGVCRDRG